MIDESIERQLKARHLEAMVEAALQGHSLGEWRPLGQQGLQYQCSCTRCGQTVFITTSLVHSQMSARCEPWPFAVD